MTATDQIAELRAYVDERWAVVRRAARFQVCAALDFHHQDISPREAQWFLNSVKPHDDALPFYTVGGDNKVRSGTEQSSADVVSRGGTFFEKARGKCWLRVETVVHMGAMWRLHAEFGWPRDHLIAESPRLIDVDGRVLVTGGALDILALDESWPHSRSTMTVGEARVRVGCEVKAKQAQLDKLLDDMRAPHDQSWGTHHETDHKKCEALREFRPKLFLGVAAGETWWLFGVEERDGRAVLGAPRELGDLRFRR